MKHTTFTLVAFLLFGLQATFGDIVVQNTNNSGAGSLRQAIVDVSPGDTITFINTLAGQTITLGGTSLAIAKNLTIDASTLPAGITISGNGASRVFEVSGGSTVDMDSLNITGGKAPNGSTGTSGGFGIGGNGGPGAHGGAILNSATLTLKRCTFFGNSAGHGGNGGSGVPTGAGGNGGNGGAISSSGTLTLEQCTLSDNSSGWTGLGNTFTFPVDGSGAGIYSTGPLDIAYTTITENTIPATGFPPFGAGITHSGGASMTLTGSIVSGNTPDINNLVGTLTAGSMNNLIDIVPQLEPLGDYGGPTQTMPPLSGSPAIDAGGFTLLTTDQRGAPRVGIPDIGAVESQSTVVLNTNDSGAGSLRQAIDVLYPLTTITFTNALSGQTILLTSGQCLINKNISIDASALPDGITISGNTNSRIFEIAANTVTLNSLTLINGLAFGTNPANLGGAIYIGAGANLTVNHSTLSGNSAGNHAGGIYNNGGILTVNYSTLSENSASSSHAGGIYNNGGTLKVNNSTLSGNSTAVAGGGIYNNSGMLTVNNSTFSGNSSGQGGGIYLFDGTVTVNSSTISSNTVSGVGAGGGIFVATGRTLLLSNSIIAGNTASSDPNIRGPFTGSNNLTSGDPQLAALNDFGGPTQTMPPLRGSPAIDAGEPTIFTTDQRGMPRALRSGWGASILKEDIGAVEFSDWLIGADVSDADPSTFKTSSVYDGTTIFPSGFDPAAAGLSRILTQAEITVLVSQGEANVTNNPANFDLYNESAFQALALDRPFLSYNAGTGKFMLTLGVLQAPDLFTTFSNLTGFTTMPYPGDGQIDIEFDAPNSDARFFEVYGTEPAP